MELFAIVGETPGTDRADFIRAGKVIRTFGEPGKFYHLTRLYLFTHDRRSEF